MNLPIVSQIVCSAYFANVLGLERRMAGLKIIKNQYQLFRKVSFVIAPSLWL